jgi:sporulation protein YqfC
MERKKLLETLAYSMDLMAEPIPGKPLVEIVGNRSVLIENHCGVISYNTTQISVRTKIGCIYVNGCNLVMQKMSKEQLCIQGKISGVQLMG